MRNPAECEMVGELSHRKVRGRKPGRRLPRVFGQDALLLGGVAFLGKARVPEGSPVTRITTGEVRRTWGA